METEDLRRENGPLELQLRGNQENTNYKLSHEIYNTISGLVGDFGVDNHRRTYNDHIIFCSTPDFRYSGTIIKIPKRDTALQNARKEGRALRLANAHMIDGEYRVPELIHFDDQSGLRAIQRLYGDDGLTYIVRGEKTPADVAGDVADWLSVFNRTETPVYEECKLSETDSYKVLQQRLAEDKEKIGEHQEYRTFGQLVETWGELNLSFPGMMLQGDASPEHLFYENDAIYGIDFNNAHTGTRGEEAGHFLGNFYFKLACMERGKEEILDGCNQFLSRYFNDEELPPDLNFHAAKSYYDKARLEKEPLVGAMLQAGVNLLEAPEFSTDLLVI